MNTQKLMAGLGFASVALLWLTVLPATAQVVDDLEDLGLDCTPVLARIIGGVTVTISTQGDDEMTARTYFDATCEAFWGHENMSNAPLYPQNVSGSRFVSSNVPGGWGFVGAQPIIFEFDAPVTGFGLTTVDLLEGGSTCNPAGCHLALRAYDSSGTMVAEHALVGAQGPGGLDLDWLVSATEIVKVVLTGGDLGDCNGYGIDDLVLAAADCDADGIFDSKDVCPCVPSPGGVDAEGRPLGDLDSDCDVDLIDFEIMQQNFTGPI